MDKLSAQQIEEARDTEASIQEAFHQALIRHEVECLNKMIVTRRAFLKLTWPVKVVYGWK